MRIEIASPPDREKLVAAIMLDGEQVAEVNQENERLQVEIYPRRDGEPWVFDLEEVVKTFKAAQQRLLDGG